MNREEGLQTCVDIHLKMELLYWMRSKDFPSKYYPVDVGLRNARLNFRQVEVTHLMECAIFNELIARGANVDVGMLEVESRKGGGATKEAI